MRTSNRGIRGAALAVVAVMAAACGGSAATAPAPTPAPTPVITPDPHLHAPASVDAVFRLLGAAGIHITPNNASNGTNGEPIKRIAATYNDWPLVLTEFSSADALRRVGRFDAKVRPQKGEAPYIVAGLNILVEFGPASTNDPRPTPADPGRRASLEALVKVLDTLLGPLNARTVDALVLPQLTLAPVASAPASSAAAAAASTAP
jgi:hypothetical protein